jgi:hypothetical protein
MERIASVRGKISHHHDTNILRCVVYRLKRLAQFLFAPFASVRMRGSVMMHTMRVPFCALTLDDLGLLLLCSLDASLKCLAHVLSLRLIIRHVRRQHAH